MDIIIYFNAFLPHLLEEKSVPLIAGSGIIKHKNINSIVKTSLYIIIPFVSIYMNLFASNLLKKYFFLNLKII